MPKINNRYRSIEGNAGYAMFTKSVNSVKLEDSHHRKNGISGNIHDANGSDYT